MTKKKRYKGFSVNVSRVKIGIPGLKTTMNPGTNNEESVAQI